LSVGQTLEISRKKMAMYGETVPGTKMHRSNPETEALRKAVDDHKSKISGWGICGMREPDSFEEILLPEEWPFAIEELDTS
jgi:hypothetical protein